VIAPVGAEDSGVGGIVVFSNGMVAKPDGELLIYYASSDTRLHVARSSVDRLLDYVLNTPSDPLRSKLCVDQRCGLIDRNLAYLRRAKSPLLKSLR
jgi:4-O-beta-D-mannosyl-D-glucose phosphorylase